MADRVQNKSGFKVFSGMQGVWKSKKLPPQDIRDRMLRIGVFYYESEIEAWEVVANQALVLRTRAMRDAEKWGRNYAKALAKLNILRKNSDAP